MRLVKAEISGFGRLAEGKINLDNKVVAIVGPNEAGKTTLLEALAYIDNGRSLSVAERSRGRGIPDDHTVVRVQYLLTDKDRGSVAEFDLEEAPQSLWLSRTAGRGATVSWVEPAAHKSAAGLPAILTALAKTATPKALAVLDPPEPEDDADADADRVALRARITELIERLTAKDQDPRLAVEEASSALGEAIESFHAYEINGKVVDLLGQLHTWAQRDDPAPAVAKALDNRTPDILLFGDDDRTLASSYVVSDEVANDPSGALANLCNMADLSLKALRAAIANGDEGERETLILNANQVLATKFAQAWRQSDVAVHLKIEGEILGAMVLQNGKRITKFDERSAGLRMFVALVAFLAARETRTPPVLLIDEAETHLHIDAQQDLVDTFMTQTQAAKIIYTTHSPACLPPDLGSNIRAVLPDKANADVSRIEASFWHSAAGFSPLMLAMGAGAAAFSAARFVVLAEGASEMLMLPTLIRSAIGVDDLDYQVAPGLSEVPTAMYPELDLEGARVAYLVDGDEGGQARKKALIEGGVPEARIVTLGALTLENLLDRNAYLATIATLVGECNPGAELPGLPAVPDPLESVWPSAIEDWGAANGLKLPGKRVVASRAVEDGNAVPSDYGMSILRDAHAQLCRVLGITSERRS
jgi:predicted ATPase